MADLHKKLFMRRKGISGVKKPEENTIDPNSALGRISAMIPSPEKTNVESTSNDEEDWEWYTKFLEYILYIFLLK